jgi:hydroxybutyrate-dimer hydrolase
MKRSLSWLALAGCGLITACGGGGGSGGNSNSSPDINIKSSFIGAITKTAYDGNSDDLLTGGLGKSGLQSATAPTQADPANPTAAELRRLTIYNNYRALVDPVPAGGFGTLFGPNVDANGNATTGEGKIAGTEYIAFADDGNGRQNVTMMIQVPNSFDKNNPCIVTAVSSGSRGVYGAIGTAGEWGLKKGCAVAYSDKGTGMGTHDLSANTVNLIDGRRADPSVSGKASNFTANLSAAELAAFNAATPYRFAFKHAHSQQNPEKDWGLHTLQAVQFALYVLNEQYSPTLADNVTHTVTIKPENTIVIASSVSNGGGASLQAGELDTQGLIDGIAVAEPQIQLVPNNNLVVKRGNVTMTGSGKGLLDYFSIANLYQPCAALAASVSSAPGIALINAALATNRCTSLKAKGLLTSTTLAAQADESLAMLHSAGWQPESDKLHAWHWALAVPPVAVTYALAYPRASVKDNLCGFSFAVTDATFKPTTITAPNIARIFATGNGVPPTTTINIVNNNNPTGPVLDAASVSPSTGIADYNIDGALCIRNLVTGNDATAKAAQAGIAEVQRTGNLHGKPAIIVHGRSDTLVPVALTSRPYFGMNKLAEGSASKLSYIEVTNAQHFDAFIDSAALPGNDTMLIPLHVYFLRAMDAMYNNLKNGAALPPSQVVRTVPRGGAAGAAPPITAANVPPISAAPAAGDLITFSGNTVTIPD